MSFIFRNTTDQRVLYRDGLREGVMGPGELIEIGGDESVDKLRAHSGIFEIRGRWNTDLDPPVTRLPDIDLR